MRYKVIITLLSVAIGFGVGWWIANHFIKPEIRIVEKTKTVYKELKQLQYNNYTELWDCYKNSISIDGVMKEDTLQVMASDECKKSQKHFKLNARIKNEKNNLIISNVSYNYDFNEMDNLWGGSVSYYRLFGPVGVGGGVLINQRSVGVQTGIVWRF